MDRAREINEVRVQNQALKPAVARLLTAYPPGHPLKLDHSLDFAVGHLDEPTANRLATLATLALLGAVAWWSRRAWVGRDDPRMPLEMAAVLVLMPLLSPVTWLQHLSFLLPATYLLAAEHLAFRRWSRPVAALIAVYVVVTVVCNRGLVGRDASLLMMSWHAHSWAMLGLLGLLMGVGPTTVRAADSAPEQVVPVVARAGGRKGIGPRATLYLFGTRKGLQAWGSKSS